MITRTNKINAPQHISRHFIQRLNLRNSVETLPMFISKVNHNEIYVFHTTKCIHTNDIVTYCLYKDIFDDMFVCVHINDTWATFLHLDYYLSYINSVNAVDMAEHIDRFNMTYESIYD